jgi:hypothetical protein
MRTATLKLQFTIVMQILSEHVPRAPTWQQARQAHACNSCECHEFHSSLTQLAHAIADNRWKFQLMREWAAHGEVRKGIIEVAPRGEAAGVDQAAVLYRRDRAVVRDGDVDAERALRDALVEAAEAGGLAVQLRVVDRAHKALVVLVEVVENVVHVNWCVHVLLDGDLKLGDDGQADAIDRCTRGGTVGLAHPAGAAVLCPLQAIATPAGTTACDPLHLISKQACALWFCMTAARSALLSPPKRPTSL